MSDSRDISLLALRRAPRRRQAATLARVLLFTVSLTAVFMIGLIFLFVGREALPVMWGNVSSALVQDVLPVEQALRLPPNELKAYLGLTTAELQRLDTTALRELAILKVESQDAIPASFRADPDARLNTTSWKYLLLSHQWTGYSRPEFVWQPISLIRKYNLVPLFIGTLKVSAVAMAVAVPLALGAAIFVSRIASRRARNWLKPSIELLAGFPSVVIGFVALVVLASLLERPVAHVAAVLDLPASRLNACVAGVALAMAVTPVVFTIADDALAAVPEGYYQSALALGATPWQAAWHVVVPAARPGLVAATILGFGRAISDTMIVLMASGNAALMSWNILQPARTLTATIAAEMDEAVFGGHHYRMLFLIGTLLLGIVFILNLLAQAVARRFQLRSRKP